MKIQLLALLIVLVACSALTRGQSSSSTLPATSNVSESEPLKPYRLVKTIPLPFVKKMSGRLGFDSENDRLFFSDGKNLVVVNAGNGERVGLVPKVERISDIAFASDLNQAFIVDAERNGLTAIDLRVLTIQEIHAGTEPSLVRYDPNTKQVFAASNRNKNCAVVDANTHKLVKTIKLEGYAFGGFVDAKSHIYFALSRDEMPSQMRFGIPPYIGIPAYEGPLPVVNEVAELSEGSLIISNLWKEPCKDIQLLGVDKRNRRLVAGCDSSVVSIDRQNGKIVTSSSISGTPVVFLKFDPDLGEILAAVAHPPWRVLTLIALHQSSSDTFDDPSAVTLDYQQGFTSAPQGRFFIVRHDDKMTDTGLMMAIPGVDPQRLRVPEPIPGTFRIEVYSRN